MNPYLILLSLGLAWLAPRVHAYAIDASCEDPDFIAASADAAIDMAAKAVLAIEPPDGAARDPNVDRLLDLLFRPDEPLDEAGETALINKIKEVFQGVAKFATRAQQLVPSDGNEVTADEVNIFCNLDRVQKRADGRYVDTSTNTVLQGTGDDHALDACKTLELNLAITWAPYGAPLTSNDPAAVTERKYLPSQVTLCPWFYQWAHTQELRQWTELRVKSGLAKVAIPVATNVWPFTPIDAIDLLDKVLLHEFTHTYACGKLDDVAMETGGAPGFGKAYGWKAATTLAKQEDNNEQKTPTRNSDSFALFASGVRLLNLEPAIFIKVSGWTTRNLVSKRDVPAELQYKRTPAAFEGFVTRIRAERAAATLVDGV